MTVVSPQLRALLAGTSVAVLGALCFATSGSTWAAEKDPHDRGGPVIFLNRHGWPMDCLVAVNGVKEDGSEYKETISRMSCDGTLWMPKLKLDSNLEIGIRVNSPAPAHSLGGLAYVKQKRDDAQSYVDNDTAICFLAKPSGNVAYTNMSAKGGDCNGD